MNASAPDARSAMARLLGWAFAAGDLLFDVDSRGVISAATGVAGVLEASSEGELNGQPLSSRFAPESARQLDLLLGDFRTGRRLGPLDLTTAAGLAVTLCAFRMPQRPDTIACSMRKSFARPAAENEMLRDREGWDASAASILKSAAQAGVPLNMDLIELGGFEASLAALPVSEADARRRKVASVLNGRAAGGGGATALAPDRYALLSSDEPPPETLADDLLPLVGPQVQPQATRLKLAAGSPIQNLRAVRYALDRFIEDGAAAAQAGFTGTVRRTLADSAKFKSIVAAKAFNMAYQPVVSLGQSGRLHHFEALARFEVDGSPADTIRLAEELDMMSDFDLVVAEMVFEALVATPAVSVAVNISANSLRDPGFVDRFLAVTGSAPAIRARMLVEVTESASLGDLREANRLIQILRQAGHSVCLDDFGAGQTSLEYVRDLEVDFLKIDGRYVKDLAEQPRGVVVIRHLVRLCQELGVPTIAEMVESPSVDRLLRELAVDLGQGWLYGKAQTDLSWNEPEPLGRARRQGAIEQWG